MAEELARAKVPFVVIDPKGDWWGLRSSRDGAGPGFPIRSSAAPKAVDRERILRGELPDGGRDVYDKPSDDASA
jgi:hypothetical protein